MADRQRWYKMARTVLGVLAAVCLTLWLGRMLYAYLVFDSPKELREMAPVRVAWLFAQGQNPYSTAALQSTVPEVTNLYGFAVPLVCSLFLRLFAFLPLSPLQLCEVLTLAAEALGLAAGWYVLNGRCRYRLAAIAGMVYLCCCYWRWTAAGGAFPDPWGLSLSLGLAACIDRDERRGKYRPCLYALGAILLLFIKQYFAFVVFGTFAYLLCRDRRAALKYAVCGIVCGSAAIAAVWFALPLYLPEVFVIAQGSTMLSRPYARDQLLYLSKTFAFAGLGIAAALVLFIVSAVRQSGGRARLQAVGRGITGLPYAGWQCLCTLPLAFYVAQNLGTQYTYYLQLWCPYYILFGLPLLDGAVYRAMQDRRLLPHWRRAAACTATLLALALVWRTADNLEQFLRVVPLTKSAMADWNRAEELLTGYAERGEVLASPHLSELCMRHGIPTADYGQAEFNSPESLAGYRSSRLWPALFPAAGELLQKNIDYNAQLREKIKNREFACIALTTQARYWLTDEEIEAAGYRAAETLTLPTGEWQWETKFYIPE